MGLGYGIPPATGSAVPGVGGGIFSVPSPGVPAQASQPMYAGQSGIAPDGRLSLTSAKDELENTRIRAMLDQYNWRRGKAAEALGITLRTLQRKMKKYGIGK